MDRSLTVPLTLVLNSGFDRPLPGSRSSLSVLSRFRSLIVSVFSEDAMVVAAMRG
jgi:hypothetical protein